MTQETWILCGYFILLIAFVRLSYRKQRSAADFILGNRSLNFWLTALSAHASDMSGWLFLGYPALVFSQGVFAAWAAIGLIVGMWCNWHFVAPRLRQQTEELGSLTLSGYFESRFKDRSGRLRVICSLMSIVFFTCYISSGLSAIGVLASSLFGIDHSFGVLAGLLIVVAYVLSGGYRTVAWLDLFQGFFLLGVIISIPLLLLVRFGGIEPILQEISVQHLSTSLMPDWTLATGWQVFLIAAGWGLGYFGQPHILTKFMGIRATSEITRAKYLGMSWQILTLGAATVIGLIGIFLFPQGLPDSQQVTLMIVKATLPSFVSGLVLCAIVAATINVMAAHVLIVASNLSEDFYKQFMRREVSSQELLRVSRGGVCVIALIGFVIALMQLSSVYHIVLYAWSGLGSSFGPLVLMSLYGKRVSPQGAFSGVLLGGMMAALWPYCDQQLGWGVPAIIPGFGLGLLAIYTLSRVGSAAAREPEEVG